MEFSFCSFTESDVVWLLKLFDGIELSEEGSPALYYSFRIFTFILLLGSDL